MKAFIIGFFLINQKHLRCPKDQLPQTLYLKNLRWIGKFLIHFHVSDPMYYFWTLQILGIITHFGNKGNLEFMKSLKVFENFMILQNFKNILSNVCFKKSCYDFSFSIVHKCFDPSNKSDWCGSLYICWVGEHQVTFLEL